MNWLFKFRVTKRREYLDLQNGYQYSKILKPIIVSVCYLVIRSVGLTIRRTNQCEVPLAVIDTINSVEPRSS